MFCRERTTANTCLQEVKYCDHLSKEWVWSRAPVRWHGAIDLRFKSVDLKELQSAGSLTRPDVFEKWARRLYERKSIPPLVVCATPAGTFYVIDGNHRLEAIRRIAEYSLADTSIRVAEIVPKPGYHFRYRWMKSYGTYMLEPLGLRLSTLSERCSATSAERPFPLVLEQVKYELEPRPRELFGRTLTLIAHPDDETACAALLQRARNPVVFFCTDGAPASEYFWGRYGSRDRYAEVRKAEARQALTIVNVRDYRFLSHSESRRPFRDQELHRNVIDAFLSLQPGAESLHADAIVAPAYEGGHPDHDTCAFLANLLGRKLGIPVWEMPLYFRSGTGELVHQQFLLPNGTEAALHLTAAELAKRAQMFSAYASQPDATAFVQSSVELYRPQPAYDFSSPPHAGLLNYEAWQWPMTGEEVCVSYRDCLAHLAAESQATKQLEDSALGLPSVPQSALEWGHTKIVAADQEQSTA